MINLILAVAFCNFKNKIALPACYRCAATKLPGAFRFKQNKLYFLLSSYCCTMFALVFSVLC